MAGSLGRIGRRIAEEIVFILLVRDFGETAEKVVAVHHGEAAGALGEGVEDGLTCGPGVRNGGHDRLGRYSTGLGVGSRAGHARASDAGSATAASRRATATFATASAGAASTAGATSTAPSTTSVAASTTPSSASLLRRISGLGGNRQRVGGQNKSRMCARGIASRVSGREAGS